MPMMQPTPSMNEAQRMVQRAPMPTPSTPQTLAANQAQMGQAQQQFQAAQQRPPMPTAPAVSPMRQNTPLTPQRPQAPMPVRTGIQQPTRAPQMRGAMQQQSQMEQDMNRRRALEKQMGR